MRVGHLCGIKENRSTYEVIVPTPSFICRLSSSPLCSFLFPQQSESHRRRDRLHVESLPVLANRVNIHQGKFKLQYVPHIKIIFSQFVKRSNRNHDTLHVHHIELKLLPNKLIWINLRSINKISFKYPV